MENSTKFTITIFSIFLLFGCGPSPEEIAEQERLAKELEIFEQKKDEVKVVYDTIQNMSEEKPCFNLEEFKNLQQLEEKHGTNLFEEKTKEKIEFYADECEKYTELNSLGNWIIVNYRDDFGELTGEKGLNFRAKGSFSNSATSNSLLSIDFAWNQTDLQNPTFYLNEYGRNPVRGKYRDRLENTMECLFRDSKGDTRTMDLYQRYGSDQLYATESTYKARDFNSENTKIFKDLVREGDKLMFVCERYFADVYMFTLDFKYAKNAKRKLNE